MRVVTARLGARSMGLRRRRSPPGPGPCRSRGRILGRGVKVELALLDQLQAGRAGDRFRRREDREHAVDRHVRVLTEQALAGRTLVDVAAPVGRHCDHPGTRGLPVTVPFKIASAVFFSSLAIVCLLMAWASDIARSASGRVSLRPRSRRCDSCVMDRLPKRPAQVDAGLRSLGEPGRHHRRRTRSAPSARPGCIAEFERALIQERTGIGRDRRHAARRAPRSAGQAGCRPDRPGTPPARGGEVGQRRGGMFKVHRATLYRALGNSRDDDARA